MVRRADEADIDAILHIWLKTSIAAHHFIDASYWESKIDDMRNIYLPSGDTYVYENPDNKDISGFICIVDNTLAAIFVLPEKQGKGIGKELLNYIKRFKNKLSLTVYAKNILSIEFYKNQGFTITGKSIDAHTGEEEYIMTYSVI